MTLRMNGKLKIENVRQYPPQTVEELRRVLAAGVNAWPDSHRSNFYEIDAGSRFFYIHLAADRNTVLLLAAWPHD